MAVMFLIRHAQSQGNFQRFLCGRRTTCPLTPTGIVQAKELASDLSTAAIGSVYTSPIERAHETARILCETIGVKPQVDDRLIEADMGTLEGKPIEEIVRQDQNWEDDFYDDSSNKYNVEKFSKIEKRMMSAVHELIAKNSAENIAAITHYEPIKSVVANLLGLGPAVARKITV
ncbi:MAG: histidine phosphatase family protein, partial [Candidatus Bathyarchaeia archaeon]